MSQGLGFIPDWQFSANPSVNPMVNPTVSMPAGMLQAGAWYAQPPYGQQTAIGPMASGPIAGPQLGYVMIDEGPPPLGFIESFWWQHRRAIILTAVGLIGAAAVGAIGLLK